MVARIRRLFFIAISNFAIPGLLNFIQLILIFSLPKRSDSEARQTHVFLLCAFIMIVFNYVCIIGVVFATIWSSATSGHSGWTSIADAGLPRYSTVAPSKGFRAVPAGDRPSIDNLSAPLMTGEPLSTKSPRSEDEKDET